MTETDGVVVILQEALNATEHREWIRNALMQDRQGRTAGLRWGENGGTPRLVVWRSLSREPGQLLPPERTFEEVGCDQVVSCCTLGYVDYAIACLAPIMESTTIDAVAAQEVLSDVLWERDNVRVAAEEWWNDTDQDEDGYYESFDEWLNYKGREEIGGEGLVPFWNDSLAQSVDDVRQLLRDAIVARQEQAVA